MRTGVSSLRWWPARRWLFASTISLLSGVLVAVPTDMVDTPLFTRDIPPTWWAWPSLILSSALIGILAATYVSTGVAAGADRQAKQGTVAGALTFFAVGCPVCNKIVLLALGYAGAMTWFRPFQPLLQLAAVALLLWALRTRLTTADHCTRQRRPKRVASTTDVSSQES